METYPGTRVRGEGDGAPTLWHIIVDGHDQETADEDPGSDWRDQLSLRGSPALLYIHIHISVDLCLPKALLIIFQLFECLKGRYPWASIAPVAWAGTRFPAQAKSGLSLFELPPSWGDAFCEHGNLEETALASEILAGSKSAHLRELACAPRWLTASEIFVAAYGGTFNGLHCGHYMAFYALCWMTARALAKHCIIAIGVTSDELLKAKASGVLPLSCKQRSDFVKNVIGFQLRHCGFDPSEIAPDELSSPETSLNGAVGDLQACLSACKAVEQSSITRFYSPRLRKSVYLAMTKLDDGVGIAGTLPRLDILVLSTETLSGGHALQLTRRQRGLDGDTGMELLVLPLLADPTLDNSRKLSSQDICERYLWVLERLEDAEAEALVAYLSFVAPPLRLLFLRELLLPMKAAALSGLFFHRDCNADPRASQDVDKLVQRIRASPHHAEAQKGAISADTVSIIRGSLSKLLQSKTRAQFCLAIILKSICPPSEP